MTWIGQGCEVKCVKARLNDMCRKEWYTRGPNQDGSFICHGCRPSASAYYSSVLQSFSHSVVTPLSLMSTVM
jgi:hypothetical protein